MKTKRNLWDGISAKGKIVFELFFEEINVLILEKDRKYYGILP